MKNKTGISWQKKKSNTSSYVEDVVQWSLILASSLVMLESAFPDLRPDWLAAMGMELVILAIVWLYRFKHSVWVLPMASAIGGWILYATKPLMVEDALLYPAQFYIFRYVEYYNVKMSYYPGQECYWGWLLIASCVAVIVVGETLARITRLKSFKFLFPFLIIVAMAYVGYMPAGRGFAILLAAIVFMRSGRSYKVTAITAIIGLVIMIIPFFSDQGLNDLNYNLRERQAKIQTEINNLGKEIFGYLPDTDIDNSRPQFTGEVLFTITAKQMPKGNLYFPTYRGADYKGGSWVINDSFEADCSEAGKDYDVLISEIMNTPNRVKAYLKDRDHTFYNIELKKMKTSTAILPYGVAYSEQEGLSYSEDVKLEKDKAQDSIEFYGPLSSDIGYSMLLNLDSIYSNVSYSTTGEDNTTTDNDCPTIDEWYNDYAKQRYTELPEDCEYILKLKEEYAVDVCDDSDAYASDSEINLNRISVASMLAAFMSEDYEYELELDDIPKGMDAVEYFQTESHKGYCKHFASVGTLLLRSYGIPARYVTGYMAKSQTFKRQQTEAGKPYKSTVTDKNAHAWVEIYLNNIGWVPVEFTPGFEQYSSIDPVEKAEKEIEERKNTENSQSEGSEAKVEESEGSEAQGSESEATEKEKKDKVTDKKDAVSGNGTNGSEAGLSQKAIKAMAILAGLAAFFGLIAGIVMSSRNRIRRNNLRIENAYRRQSYARMVRYINKSFYKRLKRTHSLSMRRASDREFERLLAKTYTAVSGEEWSRYMDITRKAVFSQEKLLSKEEADFCKDVFERCRNS